MEASEFVSTRTRTPRARSSRISATPRAPGTKYGVTRISSSRALATNFAMSPAIPLASGVRGCTPSLPGGGSAITVTSIHESRSREAARSRASALEPTEVESGASIHAPDASRVACGDVDTGPAQAGGPDTSCAIGYASGSFQKRSKVRDMRRTAGPATTASRSTKLLVGLRTKYSSPMLRPPVTAIALSATNILPCMRWLMRSMSTSDERMRVSVENRPAGKGLYSRSSMFRWRVRHSRLSSLADVFRSSTSTRTRTPRSAASWISRSSVLDDASLRTM